MRRAVGIGAASVRHGALWSAAAVALVAVVVGMALLLTGLLRRAPAGAPPASSVGHATRTASAPPASTSAAQPVASGPATSAAPVQVAQPQAPAQPTYPYQQDCYAAPHPTCTVPPPPSWMVSSPYISPPTPSEST